MPKSCGVLKKGAFPCRISKLPSWGLFRLILSYTAYRDELLDVLQHLCKNTNEAGKYQVHRRLFNESFVSNRKFIPCSYGLYPELRFDLITRIEPAQMQPTIELQQAAKQLSDLYRHRLLLSWNHELSTSPQIVCRQMLNQLRNMNRDSCYFVKLERKDSHVPLPVSL